jgi:predicted Zn-dependent protease
MSGDQTAPTVEQAHGGVSGDARLTEYVGWVGSQLLPGTERGKEPHAYRVLNAETIANAFALGNGNVYVTKGLLNMLDNEAELASVLGHENTHFDRRHIASTIDVSLGATGLGLLAKLGLEKYRGGALPAGSEQLFGVVNGVISSLVLNGFSREHEDEADQGGLNSLVRVGYDPGASVTLLRKIQKLAPDSKGVAVYFQSHPNASKRVGEVQGAINARYPGVTGFLNGDRYLGIVKRGGSLSAWDTGKILGMPTWAAVAAGLIVAGGVGYAILR